MIALAIVGLVAIYVLTTRIERLEGWRRSEEARRAKGGE